MALGARTGAHTKAAVSRRLGQQAGASVDVRPGRFFGRMSAGSEMVLLGALALVLATLIRTFLVQPFFIPSESMENTLRVGDRVLVDKVSYRFGDISRGDIVVFNGLDSFTPEVSTPQPQGVVDTVLRRIGAAIGVAPPGERDFIKRVIGLPGDTVACCDARGRVTVNGVALDETSYLYPGDKPSLQRFSVKVPDGRLWVMGDHRSLSADSRAHLGDPGGGTVPSDKVIGRAFTVVWPFSHANGLGRPNTFDQAEIERRRGTAVTPPAPLPTASGAAR